MPAGAQLPPSVEQLGRRIRDLEARLAAVERNNRNASSSIPSGGTWTFGTTATGLPLVEIGESDLGDVAFRVRRQDGTLAILVGYDTDLDAAAGTQRLLLFDHAGVPIAGDAFLSPSGSDFARVGLPFVRVSGAGTVDTSGYITTTSATFTPLWETRLTRWGPGLYAAAYVKFSDTTTACELDVWEASLLQQLPSFLTAAAPVVVPAGSTAEQEIPLVGTNGTLVLPGNAGDPLRLQLRARRTAGAGTVGVRVAYANTGAI